MSYHQHDRLGDVDRVVCPDCGQAVPTREQVAQAIHGSWCRHPEGSCHTPNIGDYKAADALMPLIRAGRATWMRSIADRLSDWEFPAGSDALEPMYRLVQTLRIEADRLEDK